MNDAQTKRNILRELEWDPKIEPEDIGVTVHDGAVTLTGTTSSYSNKIAATSATKRIAGVHAVVNKMQVELRRGQTRSDEDIAEKISHVIEWNVSFPKSKSIKAVVSNGFATLTGEVDWNFQRQNAEKLVRDIRGVTGVANLIKLTPSVSKFDVKKEIKDALERHAEIEATKVGVNVIDGKVTLTGKVESYEEMERIEYAAWAAPGVTEVIDNLKVG